MLGVVARKLSRSIKNSDPTNPNWFGEALSIAVERKVGLDIVIWEAVKELLEEQERERAA